MTINRIVLGWALFVTSLLLMGFTLPGSPFMAGDVISASEMNAKFAAIESAITTLEEDAQARATMPGTLRGWVRVAGDGTVINGWMSDSTQIPSITYTRFGSTQSEYRISWPGEFIHRDDDPAVVVEQDFDWGTTETGWTQDGAGRMVVEINHPSTSPPIAFTVLLFNDLVAQGQER